MYDLGTGVGMFQTSRGGGGRQRWRAARLGMGVGLCVALVIAACAVRLAAADRQPAERKDAVAVAAVAAAVAAAAAAPAGERAGVRVDPAAGWNAVAWASDLNTEAAELDAAGDHPRFSVEEPGKRGVWVKSLNPPVDPGDHPVLVLKYRARNIAATRYAIWLDDGTGPNNGKGVWAIDCGELVADGQVHEIRRDLSQPGRPGLPTAGPFNLVALGVSAKPGEKAWLDLIDLRFEVAGPVPPAPAAAPAPAGAAGGVGLGEAPRRWEYATLTFSRAVGSYVWEAGDARVPRAGEAERAGNLREVIHGLGGRPKSGSKEPSLVDALNSIGRSGWEMVGVDASPDARTHVFKRRAD